MGLFELVAMQFAGSCMHWHGTALSDCALVLYVLSLNRSDGTEYISIYIYSTDMQFCFAFQKLWLYLDDTYSLSILSYKLETDLKSLSVGTETLAVYVISLSRELTL